MTGFFEVSVIHANENLPQRDRLIVVGIGAMTAAAAIDRSKSRLSRTQKTFTTSCWAMPCTTQLTVRGWLLSDVSLALIQTIKGEKRERAEEECNLREAAGAPLLYLTEGFVSTCQQGVRYSGVESKTRGILSADPQRPVSNQHMAAAPDLDVSSFADATQRPIPFLRGISSISLLSLHLFPHNLLLMCSCVALSTCRS